MAKDDVMDKLQLELLAIALYQEQARILIDADVLPKAWLYVDLEYVIV